MFEEVKELLLNTLNSPFSHDKEKMRVRKIVFWYDSKRDYEELINELELENTEIIKYDNNSLWIRYHIEKEELTKNIVLYFPFDRTKGIDNVLLDLESSNSDLLFNPDATTMRLKNLNLKDECREVIKKYNKFFNDKKREAKFRDFDIDKTPENIDYIVTSILLNIKATNIDDILKNLLKFYYTDLKKYDEIFKYGNEKFILELFNNYFGSKIETRNDLPDVYKSLIFTYFATSIKDIKKVDRYSKYLLNNKATNVYVFVNNLMRDKTTKEYFEILSREVEKEFGIDELVSGMDIEEYKSSDAFKCVDNHILKYLVQQLFDGIPEYEVYKEYITLRESKYWYGKLNNEYNFLKVIVAFYEKTKAIEDSIKTVDIDNFAKAYSDNFYEVDTLYRKVYTYFDNIEDKDLFMCLKNKIENKYVNDYMSELSIKWSDSVEQLSSYKSNKILMQNSFYKNYVKPYNDRKDRIIVIISDALRYECAKELSDNLKLYSTKVDISYMLGLVPSYTKLGMAALLPNKELARIKDTDDILVDGLYASSLKDREVILQKENPDSITVKYETLYDMTKMEWKKLFSGKKVVYIYHNTIDSAGEHNENKIFEACDTAIKELEMLIRDLHATFSGINAFITADHGFFYKRSKIEDYEKTAKDKEATKQKTRYSYSNNKFNEEGIISISLDYIFGKDSGFINIPKGNIIFGRQGSGINYIHGGVLPQEVIVPVIYFKSNRASEKSKKTSITYSGLSTKITNSITYLDFLQDSNVDDNNKPCRYSLHFEDISGTRISNECTIIANYEHTEVKNRFFKEKFVFKNIKYDKNQVYFLVIRDEETGIETTRIKFYIDISIGNNFDFR
ncbi:MAG: BREX-1 system phosphatase PglZ type A, partial [Bacilli bacterium]